MDQGHKVWVWEVVVDLLVEDVEYDVEEVPHEEEEAGDQGRVLLQETHRLGLPCGLGGCGGRLQRVPPGGLQRREQRRG